jgi:hypothetical protein
MHMMMNQCGAPQCNSNGQSFDLTGHFGVDVRIFVDVQAAGGLVDQKGVGAELLLLTDFNQQGTNITQNVQVCDLTLPPVPVSGQRPLTFIIDPSLLSSVGTVTATSHASGGTTCAVLDQSAPIAILLGAELPNRLTDPLPTVDASTGRGPLCNSTLQACSPTASTPIPCICDQDGDGKLGATLGVMNAPVLPDIDKVYVALRTTVNLAGNAFSSDLVQGTVQATIEQTILGCHRGSADCSMADLGLVQGVAPTITQSNAAMDPCLTSLFVAKRVDPSVSCASLQAMRGTLFPRLAR